MTLIVCWKKGDTAFLCADTALTEPRSVIRKTRSETPEIPENVLEIMDQPSSFGEYPSDDVCERTTEALLKIVRFGEVSLAFSGNVGMAARIVENIKIHVALGVAPVVAFENGIKGFMPFESGQEISMILLWTPSAKPPSLYVYNDNFDHAIREVKDGENVFLGSLDGYFAEMLRSSINSASDGFESEKILSRFLAQLQTMCVHNPLFSKGVGGAFTGMWADSQGGHWQLPTLYIIGTPGGKNRFVVTEIESNALCVVVLLEGYIWTKVFVHHSSDGLDVDAAKVFAVLEKSWMQDAVFAKVFFISNKFPTVIDFELINGKSDYLKLDVATINGATTVEVSADPFVGEIVNRDITQDVPASSRNQPIIAIASLAARRYPDLIYGRVGNVRIGECSSDLAGTRAVRIVPVGMPLAKS